MAVNQMHHKKNVITPRFLSSQKVTSVFVILHLRDAGGQSQLSFSLYIDVIVPYFFEFIWMVRLTDIQWWNVTKYIDSSTELKFWGTCTLPHYILEANIVLFIPLQLFYSLYQMLQAASKPKWKKHVYLTLAHSLYPQVHLIPEKDSYVHQISNTVTAVLLLWVTFLLWPKLFFNTMSWLLLKCDLDFEVVLL